MNRNILKRQEIIGTGLCVLAFLVAAPSSRALTIGDFGVYAQASAHFADGSVPSTLRQYVEDGGDLETYAEAYANVSGNRSWAAANLATGALHAFGSTVAAVPQYPGTGWGATAGASSKAEMADVLWFDTPKDSSGNSIGVIVPYLIEVSGSGSGNSRAGVSWAVSDEHGWYEFGAGGSAPGGNLFVNTDTSTYTIWISLSGWAAAGSGDGSTGSYDVSHTVSFRVLLPEGVAGHSLSGLLPFYDASGNLIGEPPATAVPEPSTVFMLMWGLGLLALPRLGRARHHYE